MFVVPSTSGSRGKFANTIDFVNVTVEPHTGRLMDPEGCYTGFKLSIPFVEITPPITTDNLVLVRSRDAQLIAETLEHSFTRSKVIGKCDVVRIHKQESAVVVRLK